LKTRVAAPSLLTNSTVAGRLRALGGYIFCLILAGSFTARLYPQTTALIPNSSALDSHPLSHDLMPDLGTHVWPAPFRSSAPPLSGLQNTNSKTLRPGFGDESFENVALIEKLAWSRTLRPSGLSISFWPQNQQTQQKPPADEERKQGTDPSSSSSSPGHIFWIVPAFKVDYQKNFKPLTMKEKFHEWARGAYDPFGLGVGAFEAVTLEHSSKDGFCGYGKRWSNYGQCYGALQLDSNVSSFIGDFALTSLLHQDPRYFHLGQGSFRKRFWNAVFHVFVTYSDSGRTVFYSSALAGTGIAAAISNLYYPQQDRGFGHSMSRITLDLGNTALYNAAAEFWPDINHKLHQMF
jgi:hypothetical protein